MKKTFDLIKQILFDNKEYFIKCTLMSIIAGLILGLAISFVVPVSAAGDPIESDQVIIPAGTYVFNEVLTPYSFVDGESNFTVSLSGIGYALNVEPSMNGGTEVPIIADNFTALYVGTFSNDDATITGFGIHFVAPEDSLYEFAPYISYSGGWNAIVSDLESAGLDLVGDPSLLRQFTLYSNASVDIEFANWFFANTNGGVVPDPDPDQYIIAEGSYYLATPTNLPFEIYDDGEFFFQSGGSRFSSLRNDTIAIIYGNNVTNTPRRVYTFAGSNQGYNDFTLRSITILKDLEVTETTYNNFFASYKAVDESDEYQVGYEAGYNEGSSSGYDQGYQDGLNASAGSSDTFLGSIIEGVVDALDKLVIIGEFSVLDIIKTVIGGFVVVFLLKLIAGG